MQKSSNTKIRVLIADDHVLVREGLKSLLHEESDILVIGEAQNGQEVLDAVRKYACDVILLDISMPLKSGLDVLQELKKYRVKVPVLVLTMHPEERFAVRALKLGAAGYITKETAPKELVTAIRKVVTGRKYVSAPLAEKLVLELEGGKKLPHEFLSNREFQILCMIATGKKAPAIAKELALSLGTVYGYRIRILKKMNMKTNFELTHYAVDHHLVD